MRSLILLSVACHACFSLKILVVNPTFGTSHVNFMGAIADTFVDAGHEVHMLVNTVENKIKHYGTKKVKKIVIIPAREENIINQMHMISQPFKAGSVTSLSAMGNMSKSIEQACGDIVHYYDELLRPLEKENYDIGITQYLSMYPFMLLHMLKVKTMVLASANPLPPITATLVGIPSPSSYVANPFGDELSLSAPDFSYIERARNFYKNIIFEAVTPIFARQQRDILRVIDPTIPDDPTSLIRNVALLLINTHPMLDHSRPISHRVINIGGITLKKGGDIDKDVLAIIERAKKGVVLISFGTLAGTNELNGDLLYSFLESFAEFPDYEFLFKFDVTPEMDAILKDFPNVHMFKWLQQTSILAHNKTKAFISHMGLNSFTEAAIFGVPVVAIPLFSDQYYNAAVARNRGIGVVVRKETISKKLLTDALDKVLNDPRYSANAQLLKSQLAKFPESGKDRMVKYVEYVGEFGRLPNFDLKGAEMSYFVHHSFDIILPSVLILIFIILLLFRCIRCTVRRTCCRPKQPKERVKFE